MTNLFTDIPEELPEELSQVLSDQAGVRVERIVSSGQSSPDGFWYDQTEHEWVTVLRGEATLRFEDDRVLELQAGDHVHIPARTKHRVEHTSSEEPTVWLAVFSPAESG